MSLEMWSLASRYAAAAVVPAIVAAAVVMVLPVERKAGGNDVSLSLSFSLLRRSYKGG